MCCVVLQLVELVAIVLAIVGVCPSWTMTTISFFLHSLVSLLDFDVGSYTVRERETMHVQEMDDVFLGLCSVLLVACIGLANLGPGQ